jgi:hypothetical protein
MRSGSGLYQKAEEVVHQGTIVAIVNDKVTNQRFILTAGHVIGDDESSMVAKSDQNNSGVHVEVPTWARRKDGRPLSRYDLPESVNDETCGILKIDAKDVNKFDANLQAVDCHFFFGNDLEDNPPDPLRPLAL